jgi:hypothetical protein
MRIREKTVNINGDSFAEWLADLDRVLIGLCGLVHADLADFASYDAWQDGREVDEVAEELLTDEGFPF